MIALDTNVLFHALIKGASEHEKTKDWLVDAVESERFSTSNICIGELLRLVTHPKILENPLKLSQAVERIRHFIDLFQIEVVMEYEYFLEDIEKLSLKYPSIKGNEVHDLRIIATFLHHGMNKVCSYDADFRRYDEINAVSC